MTINSFDIKLDRVNKVYHYGENVSGFILIECNNQVKHEGINLYFDGCVYLQMTTKNFGLLETFYNSTKPISLIQYSTELKKSGILSSGVNKISFSIPLISKQDKILYETYHGLFIKIQYLVKCDLKRSILNKDLQKSVEVIVEYDVKSVDTQLKDHPKPINFCITPINLNNLKNINNFPNFKIVGSLIKTNCNINEPLFGNLKVVNSDIAIKCIKLQLTRIEICGSELNLEKEVSEIQTIQIVDGDVFGEVNIPIFMVFPRVFTCTSLSTQYFSIEFELNIIVTFENNLIVNEGFPIKLIRY